jgi:hypothetical protein
VRAALLFVLEAPDDVSTEFLPQNANLVAESSNQRREVVQLE